jgi:prepilin-type processing-associated H-X9-DG protein
VELLVVMVVLAMLAAIAYPVMVKAQKSAEISQCLSNMRQMGVALHLYLDEYDGRVPAAVPWGKPGSPEIEREKTIQELLTTYVHNGLIAEKRGDNVVYPVRSVFTCPSDTGIPEEQCCFGVEPGVQLSLQTGCSYEYYATNQKDYLQRGFDDMDAPEVPWTALSPEILVNSKRERVGAPISDVLYTTRKAVLGDIWYWHMGDQVPPDGNVAYRNTLFADGHATRVRGIFHLKARIQQLRRWHTQTEID